MAMETLFTSRSRVAGCAGVIGPWASLAARIAPVER
jgi:hypothetical protein